MLVFVFLSWLLRSLWPGAFAPRAVRLTHEDVVRYRQRCERAAERDRRARERYERIYRRVIRPIGRALLFIPRWLILNPVRDLLKEWRGSSMKREIAYIVAALVLLWLGWINRTELLIVVAWALAKGIFDRMRDQRRAIAELRAQIDSAKR